MTTSNYNIEQRGVGRPSGRPGTRYDGCISGFSSVSVFCPPSSVLCYLLLLLGSAPALAWEGNGGWGDYNPPRDLTPGLQGWQLQDGGYFPPSGGHQWRPSQPAYPSDVGDARWRPDAATHYDPATGITHTQRPPPAPPPVPAQRSSGGSEFIGGYRFREMPHGREVQPEGEFRFRPDPRIDALSAPPRSEEGWSNGWSGPPPAFRPLPGQRNEPRPSERRRSQGTPPPPLPSGVGPLPSFHPGEWRSPAFDESFYPFTWGPPERP